MDATLQKKPRRNRIWTSFFLVMLHLILLVHGVATLRFNEPPAKVARTLPQALGTCSGSEPPGLLPELPSSR